MNSGIRIAGTKSQDVRTVGQTLRLTDCIGRPGSWFLQS